jgi:hypothetical protein
LIISKTSRTKCCSRPPLKPAWQLTSTDPDHSIFNRRLNYNKQATKTLVIQGPKMDTLPGVLSAMSQLEGGCGDPSGTMWNMQGSDWTPISLVAQHSTSPCSPT